MQGLFAPNFCKATPTNLPQKDITADKKSSFWLDRARFAPRFRPEPRRAFASWPGWARGEFMRFAIVLLAAMMCAPAFATPARQAPAIQLDAVPKEVILGWINAYRHNPQPDRVPLAVRGMSRLGLLTDTEGAGVHVGFLAGILASNPHGWMRCSPRSFRFHPSTNGRSCARSRIRACRIGARSCSATPSVCRSGA